MTVQDVVNAVSSDMRQVLAPTGSDADIMIPWVDRIHKDVLHTSLFNYYTHYVVPISVVQDTSLYTLSLGGNPKIRRILSVYDRTFDRVLLPYEDLGLPSPKGDATVGQPAAIPKALLSTTTMDQWPEYYKRMSPASNQIVLFPAPQKATYNGTYEVYYEGQVATLANLSDTLVVPDDGIDLVVAGVNSLAATYLKNPEDAQTWSARYEAMKGGDFKG